MEKKLKRNTKQKELILNFLKQNKNKHLTINEISRELGEETGVTTIYRYINKLIAEGLVSKISMQNKQGFCYQYAEKDEDCTEHYHLICEECGDLLHFESEKLKEVSQEAIKLKQLIDQIGTDTPEKLKLLRDVLIGQNTKYTIIQSIIKR